MAKNSKIEWTHHTFNPWWGCVKISAACKHCYAETWVKRVGSEVWGADAPRRFFSDAHWEQPLKWNEEARREGKRRRVFCASMADVFEDRRDLDPWRMRLWGLIDQTPSLDWLLLTKRPEYVASLVPWGDHWPRNVWLGTTAEDQASAVERIPTLISYTAAVLFVSCEPILGPLDLRKWLDPKRLHWVIAGGESGAKARPMSPAWPRSLRDQCLSAGVAFHFKQWGHWCPDSESARQNGQSTLMYSPDGDEYRLIAVGKAAAGRVLDGSFWDQLPCGET
jgi:protein gp37